MSGTLNPYRHQYQVVSINQTDKVLGGTGALGDFLHRIVVNVSSTATSAFTLTDGSTAILSVANSVLPNGTYTYEFNTASQNGAWKVTTGGGVRVIGVGTFTQ